MTEWFERAATRPERLALSPQEVFGAGLLGGTGYGLGLGASPTPLGLRLDVASFGTLALIDHLIAADTSPEAFEVAMVGFDVVRDRLGSLGEAGPGTRAALRDQLAPDAEESPVLGRWLNALVDTIGSRRDLDAAITFLEETRRLWVASDTIAAINAQRLADGIGARVLVPGLSLTLGGRPLEAPGDAALVQRAVELRAQSARPGLAVLPSALDPLVPQADKVLAFVAGLPALPPATQAQLNGCILELESPDLGLCGASGLSARTLSAGFDLAISGSGALPAAPAPQITLRLPSGQSRAAEDVGRDLTDAVALHREREQRLDDAQRALDALSPGDPRRRALWEARNDAFARLGVAASVALGLARLAESLARETGRAPHTGSLDAKALPALLQLLASDAANLPPMVGGMPSATASGPVRPPPALPRAPNPPAPLGALGAPFGGPFGGASTGRLGPPPGPASGAFGSADPFAAPGSASPLPPGGRGPGDSWRS